MSASLLLVVPDDRATVTLEQLANLLKLHHQRPRVAIFQILGPILRSTLFK